MGRRKTCGSCDWITYRGKSKYIIYECAECSDVFPCRNDCGHLDCHQYRGRSCSVCNKRILRGNKKYYFIDSVGTGCYFVHKDCVDENDVDMIVEFNEL